ncbi:hypothetical protein CEP54_005523 [Fusarium duplospermum]|uniref:Uncharacterized protein n=1 Tax=Fusarium duplospermum TaxID=1325734 RepID=A0A428QC47_9HYPO|nr:hypothetical protein CEP54_005523 [Fusarium duplospermum]
MHSLCSKLGLSRLIPPLQTNKYLYSPQPRLGHFKYTLERDVLATSTDQNLVNDLLPHSRTLQGIPEAGGIPVLDLDVRLAAVDIYLGEAFELLQWFLSCLRFPVFCVLYADARKKILIVALIDNGEVA